MFVFYSVEFCFSETAKCSARHLYHHLRSESLLMTFYCTKLFWEFCPFEERSRIKTNEDSFKPESPSPTDPVKRCEKRGCSQWRSLSPPLRVWALSVCAHTLKVQNGGIVQRSQGEGECRDIPMCPAECVILAAAVQREQLVSSEVLLSTQTVIHSGTLWLLQQKSDCTDKDNWVKG